ncbi:MAG: transposase [bacterium]
MVTNKMSIQTRIGYLKRVKPRYLKSNKQEKNKILDEFCKNTEYNRKYAIRRLAPQNEIKTIRPINRKRKCTYTNEDVYWLAKVWEIMDYPCGQRLEPVLPEMIDILISFKELNIPDSIAVRLKKMSSATIDQRLRPHKVKLRRRINSTTKPGSLIKKQIPIRTVSWNEQRIGCCELDTVAHCGDSAKGEFINSLTLTDILTQWTEDIAVMGKAQKRIMAGLDDIKNRLPFKLTAIDPDNGSEFINWQLFKYCMEREVEFTRGRPYQKNDNAHVEQKNWTHVRKVFGYARRETELELDIMNDLYRNELRLYKNFFMPNVKLIEKKRVGKYGEKIKKKYDKAKTPFKRVLACEQVDEQTKEELRELYKTLNPAALKRLIIRKINKLAKIKINKPIVILEGSKVTFINHLTK